MSERFDVLIVGAGLFGATCAYELTRRGLRCMVLESRDHVGGNCYTERRDGIDVHVYGPHVFHTNDERIWDWVGRFSRFNDYRHRVKACYDGKLYSFPVNLETFRQLWGVTTREEALAHLERVRIPRRDTDNLEGWALSQYGAEVYEKFIEGYTRKQWGKAPSELSAAVLRRRPFRLTADDGYFHDGQFQGCPTQGYGPIFAQLLAGSALRLRCDYFEDRAHLDRLARKIIYTGSLDRFFDYRFGRLEYRSLKFEHSLFEVCDFQGIAVVNHTDPRVPYTRVVEHKHFNWTNENATWVTREYPTGAADGFEPMYPVRDARNTKMFEQYAALAKRPEYSAYLFGGRLGDYRYYDMHQIIAWALKAAARVAAELHGNGAAFAAASPP